MFFTSVPETVPLGGTISGTLVVQSEHSIDPMAIRVDLIGEETGFVMQRPPRTHPHTGNRPGQGPPEQSLEQRSRFLETSVSWGSGGRQVGDFYRLSFEFPLPADSPPSLRTGEEDYVASRVHRVPSFGMFREYTLEGRVQHPHWIDHVEYQIVHVVPPATSLGLLPNLRYNDAERSLVLMVNPAVREVVPGRPISGFFQLLNPKAVEFETLSIDLGRRVEYNVRGVVHQLDGPWFEQVVELRKHAGHLAGQFSVPIPGTIDTIPPQRGTLFASNWVFAAILKGGVLSKPISVEAFLLQGFPPV